MPRILVIQLACNQKNGIEKNALTHLGFQFDVSNLETFETIETHSGVVYFDQCLGALQTMVQI